MTHLYVRGLRARYGHVEALHGVDLELVPGGATVVLGANGAGKTTLLRSICGTVARDGVVALGDVRLDRLHTDEIARRGVAHVPEGRGTFADLTTEENLEVGTLASRDRGAAAAAIAKAYGWFPRLALRRQERAGNLSGGEQQMLAIGRALVSSPRVLLMDEPSFGLAPQVVTELYATLGTILRRERIAMLLVEQNASVALAVADRVYVLETGRVALAGAPKDLRDDPALRRAYLGC
jgi:branched-chain amino acid transport system ATP-binding protein